MRIALTSIILVLLAASCNVSKSVSYENLSELYLPAQRSFDPNFVVYHSSTDSSTVYFRISTEDLLYARAEEGAPFKARVRIEYELFMGYDSKNMLDSSHVAIEHTRKSDEGVYLYGSFKIPSKLPTLMVARVKSFDLNRKTQVMNLIEVDRSSTHNKQHYIVREKSGHPLFDPYVSSEDTVIIQTKQGGSKIHVLRYPVDEQLASPPFTSYLPSQTILSPAQSTDLQQSEDGFYFSPNIAGVYFFTFDKANPVGPTLLFFNENYPKIGRSEDLAPPLRYLTSRKEYNDISEAENIKKAVDGFWMNAGRNPDRAKELIIAYYDRVQTANEYFTSTKEGWMTDRGMIYLIFGPPNVLYRNSTGESWVYGTEGNYLSFTFNFVKMPNALSDNDYELSRSPIYKNYWYRSVDSWRQGRISVEN